MMRLLAAPARLRWASLLLILALPIAAAEVLLVTRAPWWKLPWRSLEVWCAAVALVLLPLAAQILRGRRWAFWALASVAAAWCALTALLALRYRVPALGFGAAFLTAYFGGVCAWIRHELGRSFVDPRMSWYEGSPRPMPGITCALASGEERVETRVARLDEDGLFVFGSGIFRLRSGLEAEMILTYREKQVRCRGVAVASIEGPDGVPRAAGFQFRGMNADARKDLGDFVEMLRGEGHA